MTARLVLHLSGAWTRDQDALLKDCDICYRMPGLPTVSGRDGWQELPRSRQHDIDNLLDQYMGLFSGFENQLSSLPFASLANDQFIYSVIPVATALTEVADIIKCCQPQQIILFHSSIRSLHIPATGVVTLENGNGSHDVLGTIVAASIKASSLSMPVVTHLLRGDALSHALIRRAAMRIASSLILLRFAFKMMRAAFRDVAKFDSRDIRGLVFVRSVEHARHAARIFSGTEGVSALITPQFTQGGIEQILCHLDGKLPAFVPTVSSLVRSTFEALSPQACVGKNQIQQITCGPFSFTASLKELESDFNAVRFYKFQNSLLKHTLKEFPSAEFTSGFEVQGPFAWIEGCVPRSAGLTSRTIQPVLVQKRPLPIFPLSSYFLTDSAPNSNDLSNIGAQCLGVVDFQDPPFEVREIREPRQSMVLGYFTQPYETENNVRIVEALCKIARARGWTVAIRLHPRDEAVQFTSILHDYPELCSIPETVDLEEFLDAIDVSITRTSSTTKEAIARGCACVNILLSRLDQQLDADYIQLAGRYLPHVVKDVDQMTALICNPTELKEVSVQLQNGLFIGRRFSQLVEFVSK